MHSNHRIQQDRQRPISRLLAPLQDFAHAQSAGGVLLLVCTVIALVWANSPWRETYSHLLHMKFGLSFEKHILDGPLEFWINDGLMAIFFFLVGLEIKRELLVGELHSPRKALLPIAAALGGMIVPALIYLQFNPQGPGRTGWGIPMATDIAFAIGILSLAGPRVPVSITVFLTALAIVDDLGAVLVIALFYTSQISYLALAAGAAFWGAMLIANRLWVRSPAVYALLSVGLWLALLKSGVHATIAGVLAALAIPARSLLPSSDFVGLGTALLTRFNDLSTQAQRDEAGQMGVSVRESIMQNPEQVAIIASIERSCEHVQSPLQKLERGLHPFVAFFIMPVFALANAGVTLGGGGYMQNILEPVSLGVLFGLFLGKPIGITLFTWAAVKLKLCELPEGANWTMVIAVAILGGIGFTMSLFVTNLAFKDPLPIQESKMAILTASLFAALAGSLVLRLSRRPAQTAPAEQPAAG